MTQPLETITEGKYEILGKIAVGGVGSIYKVRHRLLDEIRVIKLLRREHSARPEVQRRFLQEAKAAIRLKHPNIAQIYDFAVSQDGTAYIVMEYIDGVGLDRVLSAHGPPSVHLSLELAHQTLQAIDYLHKQRFVHRDLSPDNLMLTRAHDDSPWIKMIDLGIVKNLGSTSQLTVAGMFLGKARYSSPEQFSASGDSDPIDHRSDTYSFGVVLYELLTGVCPVRGETFNELAASHLFRLPVPFEDSDPGQRVPQRLRGLLLAALEKDPAARPTISELAQALGDLRDPGKLSDDEFRQIFVRAFSGGPRPEPVGEEGTTQGRVDREFGIDRTTATGTIAHGKDVDAEPEPLTAGAEEEGRAEEPAVVPPAQSFDTLPIERRREPSVESPGHRMPPEEPFARAEQQARPEVEDEPAAEVVGRQAVAPPTEPPQQLPVSPAPAPREPEPIAPTVEALREPTAAAPTELEASPRPGSRSSHWPIIGLVILFLATAAGGYLWFHKGGSQPKETIRVEAAPSIRGGATDLLVPGVGVTAPRVLVVQPAPYPPDARGRAGAVTVIVSVLVDVTGAVSEARVDEGDSSGLGFNEAAIEAARGTTFEPATRDGEPGSMWTRLRFEFKP